MDPSTAERLQKLQMADLGTARRELISTAEARRFVGARLEDIEAARMSNVSGSEAQRLANVNKEKLNEWSNMYKDIGDADDLEDLEELMHGQTHRALLSARVRDIGGQAYSAGGKRSGNFARGPRAALPRGAQSSGRGGGVAGTRGRGSQQAPPSRASNHGGVANLGNHPVEPRDRARPLDPAFDPNSDYYTSSRAQYQAQRQKARGDPKPQGQPPRTKRVASTSSFALSDPQDFMSQARGLNNKPFDPLKAPAQMVTAPGDHAPGLSRQGKSTSSQQSQTPKASSTSPAAAKSEKLFPGVTAPQPIPFNPNLFAIKGLAASKHAASTPRTVSIPAATSKPQAKELSDSVRQRHQVQGSTPKKEDVLIDLSTTPDTDEILSSSLDKMTLMSPGMKELNEIDFLKVPMDANTENKPLPPPPGLSNPSKFINFEEAMAEMDRKAEMNRKATMDVEPSPAEPSDPSIDEDLREIAELNDFIQNKSLSSGTVLVVKNTIKILEAKVAAARQKAGGVSQSSETQGQKAVGERQHISTQDKAASDVPMPTRKKEEAEAKVEEAASTPELSGKGETQASSRRDQAPITSPTRFKMTATAPSFVPGRKASFAEYRSPQSSISSESTIFHTAPSVPSAPSVPANHIIGDHLLPGRHTRLGSLASLDTPSKSSYNPDAEPYEPKWSFQTPPQSAVMSSLQGFSSGTLSMYSDTPREAATALLAPVNASETFKTPTKTTVIISSPTEPKSASDDTKPASLQSPLYAPTSSQVSTGTSSGPKATDLNTGSLQGSMYSPPADTFTAKPSAASKPLGQSRFAPENYKPGH